MGRYSCRRTAARSIPRRKSHERTQATAALGRDCHHSRVLANVIGSSILSRDDCNGGEMILNVNADPKMLRETLCLAQSALNLMYLLPANKAHSDRLQELIDECDRHRPLGPDGKHGDRHTETCGCEP